MDSTNGNADSIVLSERGRQAHVAKLPMKYFFPITDMVKNLWCVRLSRPLTWLTGSSLSFLW